MSEGRCISCGRRITPGKVMCERCDKLLGTANPFRKVTYRVIWGRKSSERLVAAKKAEQVEKLEKLGIVLGSYLRQNVEWEDVGGYEDTKEEIEDSIILPLERKDLAKTYNLKPVKGILMFGPPGCGKTLLMRALSSHIDFYLLYIKTSDILSKFYGDSEKKVSELFKLARDVAPCIIFFDEIDSIGKKRYENVGSDTITPRLLSLFLYEMDGVASSQDIIVVGSTNVPETLDNALTRPGRLDKIIYIPPPDTHAREEIFKIHLAGRPIAKDMNYKKLAELTERFSGADIANLCEDVARLVAKESLKTGKEREIDMLDLLKALKRTKTSVTFSMLERFEKFKVDYERRSLQALNEDVKETINWEDVCGLEEAKRILIEAVETPLKHPELLHKYGVKQLKGILLFGPSGCGKTMLAKAAAHELDSAFIKVSGSDLFRSRYENAVNVIKEGFYRAMENAPAILCMDEIDSIASSRGASEDPEIRKVVSEVLVRMDGFQALEKVVVLATTNKPEAVDPSLLRPGRFDKVVYIPLPSEETRKQMFERQMKGMPVEPSVTLDLLSSLTKGYSGADIFYICNEAKMSLVRAELRDAPSKCLTLEDFSQILGKIRPSVTEEQLEKCQDFMEKYGRRT